MGEVFRSKGEIQKKKRDSSGRRKVWRSWEGGRRSYWKRGLYCWGRWINWRGGWRIRRMNYNGWTHPPQPPSSTSSRSSVVPDKLSSTKNPSNSPTSSKTPNPLPIKSPAACPPTHSPATNKSPRRSAQTLTTLHNSTDCTHQRINTNYKWKILPCPLKWLKPSNRYNSWKVKMLSLSKIIVATRQLKIW